MEQLFPVATVAVNNLESNFMMTKGRSVSGQKYSGKLVRAVLNRRVMSWLPGRIVRLVAAEKQDAFFCGCCITNCFVKTFRMYQFWPAKHQVWRNKDSRLYKGNVRRAFLT
jgi:hypothetical protein